MELSCDEVRLGTQLSTCPSHVNEVSGVIPGKWKLCSLTGRKHASGGPPGIT